MSQLSNPELVRNLTPYFVGAGTPENSLGRTMSAYSTLMGLRGFWPMSGIDTSGNVIDYSGHGLTLTRNGNPRVVYQAGSPLMPSYQLDGTGDFFSRADHALFDILGTESYINAAWRGLTMGAWVRFANSASAVENIIGKRGGAGALSYYLRRTGSGTIDFQISSDGTATFSATTVGVLAAGFWAFIVARFDPSTELSVWLNEEQVINTTSIPASIFNSAVDFTIGGISTAGELVTGEITLCFLCVAALDDHVIFNIYQSTKGMFA